MKTAGMVVFMSLCYFPLWCLIKNLIKNMNMDISYGLKFIIK